LIDMIGSPAEIQFLDNVTPKIIVSNQDQYVTGINLCYEYGGDAFKFTITPTNREEQKEIARSLNSIFEIMKTTSPIEITFLQYRMTFDIIPTPDYGTPIPRAPDHCNITIEHLTSNSIIRLKRTDRMNLLMDIYNNMKKINLLEVIHTIVAVRNYTQSTLRLIPNELLVMIIAHLIPYCFREVSPFSNVFLL
jgi:hypothetical protein